MRNFKYRAWEVEAEIMHQISQLSCNPELPHITDNGLYLLNNDEKTLIMQYTGCMDKNGVEICEGDIVIIHDNCEWMKASGIESETVCNYEAGTFTLEDMKHVAISLSYFMKATSSRKVILIREGREVNTKGKMRYELEVVGNVFSEFNDIKKLSKE